MLGYIYIGILTTPKGLAACRENHMFVPRFTSSWSRNGSALMDSGTSEKHPQKPQNGTDTQVPAPQVALGPFLETKSLTDSGPTLDPFSGAHRSPKQHQTLQKQPHFIFLCSRVIFWENGRLPILVSFWIHFGVYTRARNNPTSHHPPCFVACLLLHVETTMSWNGLEVHPGRFEGGKAPNAGGRVCMWKTSSWNGVSVRLA